MRHYDIAFVGMGSIGKRHISNVYQFLQGQESSFSIDLYRSSYTRELSHGITDIVANQYLVKDDIHKMYDMAFITNPTSEHLAIAQKFFSHTRSFFIEKPVFDTAEVSTEIINQLDSIPSYVACPLRYNPVLQYVANNIDCSKAISVRAISSSYLPDWRPGQDYRNCYSAHKDMGGGVGIDLIHEWDYLTYLFGMPTECKSIQTKISQLDIDSDDLAIYIARNEKMTYELHLDYFGRMAVRTLDIFLPNDTIHCDIQNGEVDYLKSGKVLKFDSERNSYQMAEIEHFFDIFDGKTANDSNVAHAVNVLKLSKGLI